MKIALIRVVKQSTFINMKGFYSCLPLCCFTTYFARMNKMLRGILFLLRKVMFVSLTYLCIQKKVFKKMELSTYVVSSNLLFSDCIRCNYFKYAGYPMI